MIIRFVLALAGALATSGIALYDAFHQAVLGSDSAFADSYGVTPTLLVGEAVHGLTYAVLVWVLVAEAARIDGGRRFPRWTRRLLTGCFAALAVVFTLGIPTQLFGAADGPLSTVLGTVLGTVSGIAFFAMFLLAFLLGLATLRRPGVFPSAICLTLVLPVVLVAILLGVLGNPWAHPGYAEALVNVGVALFAYHRIDRLRTAETDPSSGRLTLSR